MGYIYFRKDGQMSKANPRKIALNILNDTIINKQMLDFALSREFANNDIASNDRGLIRMIRNNFV